MTARSFMLIPLTFTPQPPALSHFSPNLTVCIKCTPANTAGIPTAPKRRSASPGEPVRSAAASDRHSRTDGTPSAAGPYAVRSTGAMSIPR